MEKTSTPERYLIFGGRQQLGETPAPEISEAEQLMNEFEAHDGKEGEFIRCYKEIAEKSNNPLIKFLLQLIISDEEKHHAVIHAMASSLRGGLTWSKPWDAIPSLGELDEERRKLLKLTWDFIEHEKEGIREFKKLVKSSKGYYQGLFALLLKLIIHDSKKHVEVLEFLRQRLREV